MLNNIVELTQLPSDMLVLIFSWLSELERHNLRFVNRRLHQLITGEHYWLATYKLLYPALTPRLREIGVNYQKLYSFLTRNEDIERFILAKKEMVEVYRRKKFIQNYKANMIAKLRDYKPTKEESKSRLERWTIGISSITSLLPWSSSKQDKILTDEMKKDEQKFIACDLQIALIDLYFDTWKWIEATQDKDIASIVILNTSLQARYKKTTDIGLTHTLYLCAELSGVLLGHYETAMKTQASEFEAEEKGIREKIDIAFNRIKTGEEIQQEEAYKSYIELSNRYSFLTQQRESIMNNVVTTTKNGKAQYGFDRNGLKQCAAEIPEIEDRLVQLKKTTPSCATPPKKMNTAEKLNRLKQKDPDNYYRYLSANL